MRDLDGDRHGRPVGEFADGGLEPPVGQHRGVHAGDRVAQRGERQVGVVLGRGKQPRGGGETVGRGPGDGVGTGRGPGLGIGGRRPGVGPGPELLLEQHRGLPQLHPGGDEVLLRAVVQVTLDAATFELEGRDDLPARGPQLLDPARPLGHVGQVLGDGLAALDLQQDGHGEPRPDGEQEHDGDGVRPGPGHDEQADHEHRAREAAEQHLPPEQPARPALVAAEGRHGSTVARREHR